MQNRLVSWWFDWQQSLWFLPAVLTLGATALALLMVRLDQTLALSPSGHYTWAFGGGASGARGVLEAIAGSMITVTGTVFSITIVALQLASSQFSPRVLRAFTSDRGVQLVLGVFVGTFTYSLLVLRSVRSEFEDGAAFVPSVSVTVAVGLALVSIGCLIYYIHHIARSIQVATVADRVAQDTHRLIDEVFNDKLDDSAPTSTDESEQSNRAHDGEHVKISATASGYLQRIDDSLLFEQADDRPVTIQSQICIGDFVLAGAIIATIWPVSAVTEERNEAIRAAHILGLERSLAEDVDFGLRQLADIAVKALSPGVNDPTTATDCIDRIAELIGQIVRRHPPSTIHHQPDSHVTVIRARRSVEQLIDTAFTQIRLYGVGDVVVMTHLVDLLGQLASIALPRHRLVLVEQGRQILAAVEHRNYLPSDRDRIISAADWTQ